MSQRSHITQRWCVCPSSLNLFFFWYNSTRICSALHLACGFQMQLPDFLLIGPSGQLRNELFLVGTSLFNMQTAKTGTHAQKDGTAKWKTDIWSTGKRACNSMSWKTKTQRKLDTMSLTFHCWKFYSDWGHFRDVISLKEFGATNVDYEGWMLSFPQHNTAIHKEIKFRCYISWMTSFLDCIFDNYFAMRNVRFRFQSFNLWTSYARWLIYFLETSSIYFFFISFKKYGSSIIPQFPWQY